MRRIDPSLAFCILLSLIGALLWGFAIMRGRTTYEAADVSSLTRDGPE